MSGFDVEKAHTLLRMSEGFAVEIPIAVGQERGRSCRLACCSVNSRAVAYGAATLRVPTGSFALYRVEQVLMAVEKACKHINDEFGVAASHWC